jgi:hypothetical protein
MDAKREDAGWDRPALLAGLAVVVILGLAALAVPAVSSRGRGMAQSAIDFVGDRLGLVACPRPATQSNAIAACKEIGSAQSIYHRTDWDGDGVLEYASSFPLLYNQVDVAGMQLKLVSEALSLATGPATSLHGYWFVDITAHEEAGPYADANGNQPDDFGICAVPATYPRSGRETYIMDATGTVWGKDTGGLAVTIFPADPRAAGWEAVE